MKKWVLYIASLLYPFWGTMLTVYIASLASSKSGDSVLFFGLLGLILSAFPLFKIRNTHVAIKVLLSICYFFVSSIVIFILGRLSLCWFFQSCH